MRLGCRLARRNGNAVEGTTVDVGPGGMCVTTSRPLAPDELLEFSVPERPSISGRARVLREQRYRVYALRFERLSEDARAELDAFGG